jgi:protein-S-isoprenylcysteine O-methyltransferase Ste14
MTEVSPPCPKSDVSSAVGGVGLVVLVGWVVFCAHGGLSGSYAALCGLGLVALAMAGWSVGVDRVHLRPSCGIDWAAPRPWRSVLGDGAVKLVGLWATWAAIAALYCLFRFYWQGPWRFALRVMAAGLVPLVLCSLPYVLWLERVLVDPRDGAWHFGAWVLGREADGVQVLGHMRRWAVKGFFGAFMLSIVPDGFAYVVDWDWRAAWGNPVGLADGLIGVLFLIDVMIGTVGYLLTLRPLDAHIRSADPHLEGWVAALICYPPFVLMGAGGVMDYHQSGAEWSVWMARWPWALWLWGAWLVALTGIYAWATVAFGLRFSNLTYRGVVTHGPYRWTRHPAYLAKNLFWWSASLPFLVTSGSVVDGMRNGAMLAMVGGIYYWRSRCEERHLLGQDAQYRAYHAWAARYAPITRMLGQL